MKRLVPALLPFVALALMGNSCEFRAGVNNSLPPAEGEAPGEGSGLRVLVRSGDPIEQLAVAPALGMEGSVAAALSMSALTSAHFTESEEPDLSSEAFAAKDLAAPPGIPTVSQPSERPVSAVPEPSGMLLFAAGICAASIMRRKR